MNNLEWSLLIWGIIALLLLLKNKSTRSATIDVLRSLLDLLKQPALKLFCSYQIILLFFLFLIICKFNLDFWIIKDYLITSFFSILPFASDTNYDFSLNQISHTLLSSFTISAIISFLTSQYTFSILTELIIVPILFLLGTMIAIANKNSEYEKTAKFLRYLIFIILTITVIHSIIDIVINYKDMYSVMFFINYFSDFIFWFVNIPLLFIWQYVNQLDILLSFLSIKKKPSSFFIYLIKNRLLLIINLKRINKVNLAKIKLIKRGGLGKRFYWITVSKDTSMDELNDIVLMIRTLRGPLDIYPDHKKIFPLKIIFNYDDYSGIPMSWSDKLLDKF